MIEVGKIYRLFAPWHPTHGKPVLVVCKRTGMSEAYQGRDIYHALVTDTLSGSPDMDTEFIEDNFREHAIGSDLNLLMRRINNDDDLQRSLGRLNPYGDLYVGVDHRTGLLSTGFVAFMVYSYPHEKSLHGAALYNLRKYFDEEGNFNWNE